MSMLGKRSTRGIVYVLIFTLVFSLSSSWSTQVISAQEREQEQTQEQAQDQNNIFSEQAEILYFVNAGDPTPSTVEAGDQLGLYGSVTDQEYGLDPVTGKTWGLQTETTAVHVSDESVKSGSLRYYTGSQHSEKGIAYDFELPEGEYDVTFGFFNPWSGRSVNLIAENSNLTGGNYHIGENELKEFTYRGLDVADGMLNVIVQGPQGGDLHRWNDPLINYIIIRTHVVMTIQDLQTSIAEAEQYTQDEQYTQYSLSALRDVIAEANQFVLEALNGGIDESTIQTELHTWKSKIEQAILKLQVYETYSSFKPGEVWKDNNGVPIQAHGGGILYDENTATYYWYGEDKTYGYSPTKGVHVYSSQDLYNWKDEGLALTAIESMDQFDIDPLISQLYEGRTDRDDIFNDIGSTRVLERPKVIYNDNTGKYVMWLHTDGPSATSTANYAKAEAGYALSDSPTGPFIYGKSERMDRVPPNAEYNGQPNQPGMARDMTLFKDDDGTAYLIYSSEENMTIYISKLNEEYTDVVGWHKEGKEERDTTYQAEYGVDYVRVFPGAQREAPAIFKYEGKYYLITSGATGWAPNPARYTVADHIFGPWKPMRDPSVGNKAATTFDSQSTFVIPVDPDNGKFIYMGDRWKQGDLKDSRYVWLPIEFGQDEEIKLKWYDEWDLSLLDRMERIKVTTPLPTKTMIHQTLQLPDQIEIETSNGQRKMTPVNWNVQPEDFTKPNEVTITGTLPELANREVSFTVDVVPSDVVYFVNAGGALTEQYARWLGNMDQSRLLNPAVPDQEYNPEQGQTWGYVGENTNTAGSASGDLFTSLRYLKGNSGDDLSYQFDDLQGEYTVYMGLYDPWYSSSKGNRVANIVLNDEIVHEGYTFTSSKDVLELHGKVENEDGLEVTIRRSPHAPASNSDPQISWIMIVKQPTAQEIADQLKLTPPKSNDTKLNLPAVKDGYELKLMSSSHEQIVNLQGEITPPNQATKVTLTLQVTRQSDYTTGTVTIELTIPAKSTITPPNPSNPSSSEPGSSHQAPISGSAIIPVKPIQAGDFVIASPVVKNGTAQITVSPDGISKLQSKQIQLDLTELTPSMDNSINKSAWDIGLPLTALQKLSVVEELVITTSSATITIPMKVLQQLSGDDKGSIVLSISVDSQLGKKPTITLGMKAGNNVQVGNNIVTLPTSSDKAKTSIQITLPYLLLSTESASFVQVLKVDADGKENTILNANYDSKQKAMNFEINDLGTYKIAYVHHQFSDVPKQHWARQQVEILASKGIIQGTSESTFDPTAEVRRGDFLVLLMRALELSTEQPSQNRKFSDVKAGEYWYHAIQSAGQLGIVQGTKEAAFEPTTAITREEMFVFIHRALTVAGKAGHISSSEDSQAYSDWNQVSAYAREAVSQLLEQGIVTGSDSKVKPKNTATRAEAATLIYRVFTIQ